MIELMAGIKSTNIYLNFNSFLYGKKFAYLLIHSFLAYSPHSTKL